MQRFQKSEPGFLGYMGYLFAKIFKDTNLTFDCVIANASFSQSISP